ncbi:hypothetical protein N6H18_14220 [Reichenbachiella agarivorans]|uniref:Secreted protein n=1 Tax=Reichenbachiella agarivorans TaxID=2979464 RepID=A0ABY6CMA0_9BACT|nr:hypothetical protein [Reichenbachiella agarivorans]UXP31504.1 hypothetical protein N6H18_14220 [Reichenbachiella agarivorans]
MRIAKNIFIYLLALNTLASTLAVPLIYMDFGMRRDYIAEVLCINRDKPMSTCDGKCYLAQKLKAAQQQQEQENETVNIKSGPIFFSQGISSITWSNIISILNPKYLMLQDTFVLANFLYQVFVPPRG